MEAEHLAAHADDSLLVWSDTLSALIQEAEKSCLWFRRSTKIVVDPSHRDLEILGMGANFA